MHSERSQPERAGGRSWLVRFSLTVVVPVLVMGCLWAFRAPILQSAAEAWAVSDPLEPADAVVVLGGGANTRPFAAADDYQAGLVKVVLLPLAKATRAEAADITASHSALNRAVLLKRGVPAQAVLIIGNGVVNTRDEAAAVRDWAQAAGAKKVIVVTEKFPARRVRWVFNRELSGLGVKVIMQSVPELEYDYRHWWVDERGIVAFQNEILKYVYYRLKY